MTVVLRTSSFPSTARVHDITDLEITQLNQDFDNSTIEADVGVTCDSITLFARHLSGLNARRPENMRKDDNDMTRRLLHVLNANLSPSMHLSALKEMCASADKREFHDTFTGMRDFAAAIQELDEIWRSIFNSGMIKPAACSALTWWRTHRRRLSIAEADDCDDEDA